jgi:hypothetical protein
MTFWVSKLKKLDVPCDSWFPNDFTGVVEVINYLNHLRFEIDKAVPHFYCSLLISQLYTLKLT